MVLAPVISAGCGSHSHAVTLASVKSCLVDSGFVVRGEGQPGSGDALAVRTPGPRDLAYAVVAILESDEAATAYRARFIRVLDRPPRNPRADYLKTLVRRRGRLVYGWTTQPSTADVQVLEDCTQVR